jgi:hypothetical protein
LTSFFFFFSKKVFSKKKRGTFYVFLSNGQIFYVLKLRFKLINVLSNSFLEPVRLFEIVLKNIDFKAINSFLENVSLLNFSQKCILIYIYIYIYFKNKSIKYFLSFFIKRTGFCLSQLSIY